MSYVQARGHRHEQSTADTTWSIVHNLNTLAPIVDCWINVGGTITKILPLSVVATNVSTVTITFSSAQAGVAFVA